MATYIGVRLCVHYGLIILVGLTIFAVGWICGSSAEDKRQRHATLRHAIAIRSALLRNSNN